MLKENAFCQAKQSLKPYNSWHVGGICDWLVKPPDSITLQRIITQLPADTPLLWLGLGSNVLIRDGGFPGVAILTQPGLNKLTLTANQLIRAEAGVTCAKMAKFAAKHNRADAAFFAGIPGTMGGAMRMNAGAFQQETWNHCIAVETLDRAGKLHYREKSQFTIAYREVKQAQTEWFLAGYFQFPLQSCQANASQQIKALLKKRNESQPIGQFSCGSVFRNPPNDYAGRLLEACQLKGHRMGGAVVSTKHANFIINDRKATASDIEQLILLMQQAVKRQTGIELMPECHIIGEP